MLICLWPGCGGWINEEGRCGKCGRSLDMDHENYVKRESKKKHRNWQLSGSCYIREMRKKSKKLLLEEGRV
jgi:hypothetical protein